MWEQIGKNFIKWYNMTVFYPLLRSYTFLSKLNVAKYILHKRFPKTAKIFDQNLKVTFSMWEILTFETRIVLDS